MKKIVLLLVLFLVYAISAMAAETALVPVQDEPVAQNNRMTVVRVETDGNDSLGMRLATKLKERFNQSSLFALSDDEEKDIPELRLLLKTTPEFPARPNLGSVYGVCWVLSPGKGYLGHLLARDLGTVTGEDMDALVDKLVERTDGIAAKYAKLLKH